MTTTEHDDARAALTEEFTLLTGDRVAGRAGYTGAAAMSPPEPVGARRANLCRPRRGWRALPRLPVQRGRRATTRRCRHHRGCRWRSHRVGPGPVVHHTQRTSWVGGARLTCSTGLTSAWLRPPWHSLRPACRRSPAGTEAACGGGACEADGKGHPAVPENYQGARVTRIVRISALTAVAAAAALGPVRVRS